MEGVRDYTFLPKELYSCVDHHTFNVIFNGIRVIIHRIEEIKIGYLTGSFTEETKNEILSLKEIKDIRVYDLHLEKDCVDNIIYKIEDTYYGRLSVTDKKLLLCDLELFNPSYLDDYVDEVISWGHVVSVYGELKLQE